SRCGHEHVDRTQSRELLCQRTHSIYWLVNILHQRQAASHRSNVTCLQQSRRSDLCLDVQIEILRVRRAIVLADGKAAERRNGRRTSEHRHAGLEQDVRGAEVVDRMRAARVVTDAPCRTVRRTDGIERIARLSIEK